MDLLLHQAAMARIDGDYRRADQLMRVAIMQARPGSAESSAAYRKLAGLRVEQLRPREALALLARSEQAAKLQGSPAVLVAPIRVTEASALADAGEYDDALLALTEASRLYAVGAGIEGRLRMLAGCHLNLVWILTEAREVDRALYWYGELDTRIEGQLDERAALRWRWQRPRMMAAEGLHRAAERYYQRVLDSAGATDTPLSSGWLLDLAVTYAALGRREDLCRVTSAMRSSYLVLGVPDGVLAAIRMLALGVEAGDRCLSALVAAVRRSKRVSA